MPIGPSKRRDGSIYVRVSRLKLYGPRWPECKAHLQPDESPPLLAYARHRFHPLAFLQNGRCAWCGMPVRGFARSLRPVMNSALSVSRQSRQPNVRRSFAGAGPNESRAPVRERTAAKGACQKCSASTREIDPSKAMHLLISRN